LHLYSFGRAAANPNHNSPPLPIPFSAMQFGVAQRGPNTVKKAPTDSKRKIDCAGSEFQLRKACIRRLSWIDLDAP
jgi:hypothetical protein